MALKNSRGDGPLPPEAARALELQSIGAAREAEACLRAAMRDHPRDGRAPCLLAAMLMREKRVDEAEEALRQGVKMQPAHAETWNMLGALLLAAGRAGEARGCFEKALKIRPDFVEALTGLGETMIMDAKWPEAESKFAAALKISPEFTRARHGRAWALLEMKRCNESLCVSEAMLRQNPGDQIALGMAHNALSALRDSAKAKVLFRDIAESRPQSGPAWLFLADHLARLGEYGDAEAACAKALELMPRYSAAHLSLAVILLGSGRFAEADAHMDKCLECAPDDARELEALLSAFSDMGLNAMAEGLCRRILALAPGSRRAESLLIIALELLGRPNEAAPLRAAAMRNPDRDDYVNLICSATMNQSVAPRDLLGHARAYASRVLPENARRLAAAFQFKPRAKGERIRVGFVSHEVRAHSVAAFLAPVITHLDRERIEVFLYSADAGLDETGKRLAAGADHFADISALSPLEKARFIRKDRIDIAVDTTGYTDGCNIATFAHRAAPVQAHYIGYFGTSGLEHMDYFIGDEIINPPEDDVYFTEKVWRLPCFWTAWQERSAAPEIKWAPAADGRVTLGSFNALYKLGAECLDLWGEIMLRLPGSRLLLKNRYCADKAMRAHITDVLGRKGIERGRIEFRGGTPGWSAHMALYDQVDLCLDPLPFNGCTTAFEALWMGVPMIALEGAWMGGRVGAAMLRALGRPEWVAQTRGEYVDKAVELARNIDLRRSSRAAQRERMRAGPLCDHKGVARALAEAFAAMRA